MTTSCPHCQSDQTQSLRVVFEQGAYTTETKTSGMGIALDGQSTMGVPVMMSGKSTGFSQSEASMRATPPQKFPVVSNLLGGLFASFLVITLADCGGGLLYNMVGFDGWHTIPSPAGYIVGMVFFVLCFKRAKEQSAYNKNTFDGEHATWQRSWQCNACGNHFILANQPQE
jgi:hypothetical protein